MGSQEMKQGGRRRIIRMNKHEKIAAKAKEMQTAYESYLKIKKEYEELFYNAKDD